MQILDKWADRIYSETDVGRSVATSSAGVIGLITYLTTSDWVIAAFAFLIVFRSCAYLLPPSTSASSKRRIANDKSNRRMKFTVL